MMIRNPTLLQNVNSLLDRQSHSLQANMAAATGRLLLLKMRTQEASMHDFKFSDDDAVLQ